eukprot:GHVH01001912.1.p1 GENE.GHVH01001912.1~~GHVH01001912.1.p1  ORF type:complete len:622 (+),score=82.20 GHVH01001912.1:79-1944(+)
MDEPDLRSLGHLSLGNASPQGGGLAGGVQLDDVKVEARHKSAVVKHESAAFEEDGSWQEVYNWISPVIKDPFLGNVAVLNDPVVRQRTNHQSIYSLWPVEDHEALVLRMAEAQSRTQHYGFVYTKLSELWIPFVFGFYRAQAASKTSNDHLTRSGSARIIILKNLRLLVSSLSQLIPSLVAATHPADIQMIAMALHDSGAWSRLQHTLLSKQDSNMPLYQQIVHNQRLDNCQDALLTSLFAKSQRSSEITGSAADIEDSLSYVSSIVQQFRVGIAVNASRILRLPKYSEIRQSATSEVLRKHLMKAKSTIEVLQKLLKQNYLRRPPPLYSSGGASTTSVSSLPVLRPTTDDYQTAVCAFPDHFNRLMKETKELRRSLSQIASQIRKKFLDDHNEAVKLKHQATKHRINTSRQIVMTCGQAYWEVVTELILTRARFSLTEAKQTRLGERQRQMVRKALNVALALSSQIAAGHMVSYIGHSGNPSDMEEDTEEDAEEEKVAINHRTRHVQVREEGDVDVAMWKAVSEEDRRLEEELSSSIDESEVEDEDEDDLEALRARLASAQQAGMFLELEELKNADIGESEEEYQHHDVELGDTEDEGLDEDLLAKRASQRQSRRKKKGQ